MNNDYFKDLDHLFKTDLICINKKINTYYNYWEINRKQVKNLIHH